ncbi:tail tape measure protein [Bacillus phage SP82G]|nr:tail tape measure protein [Bacillus phage SP82G]
MTRVFADNLKKGVPYAIKHKYAEDILYGLYSGLLDPETALFRYLNGEHKVSIHKLESGMVEIHEIVEDKEAF